MNQPFFNSSAVHQNALFLTLILVFPTAASQADDWSWNPFSKSATSPESAPIYSGIEESKPKSTWMPTFMPPKMPWSKSDKRVSTYSRANSSKWSQLSKTSKRWWSKTAEVLDPYPDPKPTEYSKSSHDGKKKNWLTGWFQQDEPKETETVSEWLRQETPKY